MAFECPHCNERNNEVLFTGQPQPQGCTFRLKVPAGDSKILNTEVVKSDVATIESARSRIMATQDVNEDVGAAAEALTKDGGALPHQIESVCMRCGENILNRQVVKSDVATIKVPELEFEIPPVLQRGTLSTIKGVLTRAGNELQALQEERRKLDVQIAEGIDAFLAKLNACAEAEQAFVFVLDDPAGNSYIENPHAPSADPLLSSVFYDRSEEEQEAVGFLAQPTEESDGASPELPSDHKSVKYAPAGTTELPHGSVGALMAHQGIAHATTLQMADPTVEYSEPGEVMIFPATCGACGGNAETRIFVTNIPYSNDVIVMAFYCDECGYKDMELKPGGRYPDKGKNISLLVKSPSDLSREVVKSDTASVEIPELELELSAGTLGGLVTTAEGLLSNISESLNRVHGFSIGDSAEAWEMGKWQKFDAHLRMMLNGEEQFTLILDDALANSFIAPATDDIESNTQLKSKEYDRSFEKNEDLGLNDMDTSGADGAYTDT